jgi:predicted nucleic acid-binding protein
MNTLIDSNVIIDLLSSDSPWKTWAETQIKTYFNKGALIINPIIYAEIAYRFIDKLELDAAIPVTLLRRESLPWEAAFLAAQCYKSYRKQGGQRTTTLPDFFIGAHAAVTQMPLLTRDVGRYSSYFPQVQLIAP